MHFSYSLIWSSFWSLFSMFFNVSCISIFWCISPVYALIFLICHFGSLFFPLGSLLGPYFIKKGVPIGSIFHKNLGPYSYALKVYTTVLTFHDFLMYVHRCVAFLIQYYGFSTFLIVLPLQLQRENNQTLEAGIFDEGQVLSRLSWSCTKQ